MKNGNIVVLAGGISSRMKKNSGSTADPSLLREAREKSKAMIGVGSGSRPFLDYLLFNIREAGYREAVIVVGETDPGIRAYYEAGKAELQFSGLSISFASQKIPPRRSKPAGTADALLEALKTKRSWENDSFTVCNSDNLYSISVLRSLLLSDHSNAMIDYDRLALRFDQKRIEAFAVIRKDKEGFLLDIIEKPTPSEIEGATDCNGRVGISMNIFKLAYGLIYPVLETMPFHPIRREKELPIAVKMMVELHPRCLKTIPVSEHVVDLTTQSDIAVVQEYLRKNFPLFNGAKNE